MSGNTALTFAVTSAGNSYVSAAEADEYFDLHVLFPEPWTTTQTATKEKALVAATRKIDMQMLIGRKVDLEQELEFPRALYSDTKSTRNYNNTLDNNLYLLPGWVAEEEVSQAVKDATCEEALALLKSGAEANKRAELQRQGVTSFNLGSLSESYSGGSAGIKLLSPVAAQLLARYIGGGRVIV
jgi:hypothetical protein